MLQDGTDDLNKALRCMPPFQNVISNARVSVRPEEMTCGVAHQVEYCMQSGGYYRECQICDSTLPDKVSPLPSPPSQCVTLVFSTTTPPT